MGLSQNYRSLRNENGNLEYVVPLLPKPNTTESLFNWTGRRPLRPMDIVCDVEVTRQGQAGEASTMHKRTKRVRAHVDRLQYDA